MFSPCRIILCFLFVCICAVSTCKYNFTQEDEDMVINSMEKLHDLTFAAVNFTFPCNSAMIDYHITHESPYIWKVRFETYEKIQPQIRHCQCSDEVTSLEEYKTCMGTVRDELRNYVTDDFFPELMTMIMMNECPNPVEKS